MAYSKYYPEGWKDNEEGGTPINAAALNNMEAGITAAHTFMARTDNPHGVTKAQVGLGNAQNTADADKEVKAALTLKNARTLDGVSFNGSANITHYATCSTAAATTAKTATLTGFTLAAGARITVKFTVTNTGAVGSLTLNVNSTGAKPIKYRGGNLPAAGALAAGRVYTFVYDGTSYELVGDLDSNTTYTPASATPLMDGVAAVGTSAKYAREDHQHPTDTSRASAADVTALVNYIKSMEVYRTASGNPATFSDAKAANVKDLLVTMTPTQSGSGDPSPDNVRPISGVTSVSVTRSGKNLLPFHKFQPSTENAVYFARSKDFNDALTLPAGTYAFSYGMTGDDKGPFGIFWRHTADSASWPSAAAILIKTAYSATVTLTQTEKVMFQLYRSGAGNKVPIDNITWAQLEIGETPSDHEPYQGQNVTVTLTDGSNPLTVYGGTLDVMAGTLTITHILIEKTTQSMNNSDNYPGWQYPESAPFLDYFQVGDAVRLWDIQTNVGTLGLSANKYSASNIGAVWIPTLIGKRTQSQWMSEYPDLTFQFLMPLITPLTYQLAPQQLATLSGYNAVSADAGTVSVIYKADPVLSLGGGT